MTAVGVKIPQVSRLRKEGKFVNGSPSATTAVKKK